jgi:hypothetical protein
MNDNRCAEWAEKHVYLSWDEIATEGYEDEKGNLLSGNAIRKRVRKWKKGTSPAEDVPSKIEEEKPVVEEEALTPIHVTGIEVKGDIIFEDKKPQPTDADVQKLLDAYITVMDAAKPFDPKQRFANVRFKDNLPIGMNFIGDEHVGSWSWAAKRHIEDLLLTAKTDGLYPSFLGDGFDNFIFGFGKWASAMSPDHQRRIYEYIMKEIFPKTVAYVGGNHPDWTKKVSDVDLNARMAMLANCVFLGWRGDLNVHVGNETYHLHMHHRARNASSINKTNSARVASDDTGGADIIVEADRHDGWCHQEYKARKRQTWLRVGTYKLDDGYVDEIGFQQAHWDMPMAIMFPDTHKVVPFWDFHDGIDTLTFLRDKYRTGRIISA